MGYRALLKNYIRHLVRVAGDHYIGAETEDGPLTRRDLAELRLLAAEVEREDDRPGQRETVSPSQDSAARTSR
jgi:hypothetical protein